MIYMEFQEHTIAASGVKIIMLENDQEIGHAFVYVLKNDLHEQPFAFLEDVMMAESQRGRGLGKLLVEKAVATAKARGCYKLVGTSRYSRETVHKFYEKLGFKDCGKEFRMDF